MDSGSQPEPPPGRVAAVNDAVEAWSALEQFFVLSYRATQGVPILVTELSIHSAAVLGVSPETIASDPGGFARLVHPDDRDRVLAEHWDAAARGEALLSEYRMVGRNGSVLWIYDEAAPIVGASGKSTLHGHCLDVTPRRRTEPRPSGIEEYLHSAVAGIPGAIYRCACDATGTIEFMSDQIEDLVGYPASDFIGNKVRSYDSIVHPEDLPYMISEVNDALERGSPYSLEYRVIHLSGEARWVTERGRPVLGLDGKPQWTAGVILDLTRQKAAEASRELLERQVRHHSLHDSLTGLTNEAYFRDSLAHAISEAREAESELVVFVMNLDRFKEVNDTLGREIGDRLLQEVGSRFHHCLRGDDSIARLAGDEFAVLVTGAGRAEALEVVHRLREALEPAVAIEGLDLEIEVSVGIACCPRDGADVDSLLRSADTAMRVAKDAKLGYAFFDVSVDTRAAERLALVGELRRAIDEHELVLHYQPKIAVQSGRIVGVEALVRWQDSGRGLVMPDEFIPVVSGTSLIRALTQRVLEEAARQWRAWSDAGLSLPISVNLSQRDLLDPGFPGEIAALLGKWRMPAKMLKLEVAERAISDDPARTEDVLERLGAMGLCLSVDDYGTGGSSIASLKSLPIDEIKIDRTFVSAMVAREEDEAIVRAVIELAHNLGLGVVAEGVEKRAVMERLAQFGCDFAQGYYVSRPVPPDELVVWLEQNPAVGAPELRKRKFREDSRETLASA
ncbi:MAG: EAL domain-containing protein [Acidimicrobiales bacterium]|jgi:diguanylate cyclase (GGDEF)-like protein/PAS domain S-box-containing protein